MDLLNKLLQFDNNFYFNIRNDNRKKLYERCVYEFVIGTYLRFYLENQRKREFGP